MQGTPDRSSREQVFVGRAAELSAIVSCLRTAAAGRAQVVWIEGPGGAGKTALVRRVLAGLPGDVTVLRAEADELATDMALAVVSQLGRSTATGAFAAGLELIEQLSVQQDDGPVVVVVEDLHWADAPSRQALLTVARRLHDDRVLVMVTTRPGAADDWERFSFDPDRCLRVVLGGFADADVAELAAREGVALTARQAARLRRHTDGLPLYLRTLLSELTPDQLTTGSGELPAPRSLASATIAGLSDLPAPAQALASALAVLAQRTPLARAATVGRVEQPTDALDALLATGYVRWWPAEEHTPIEFSHPLYRAAVYDDLSPSRRRQLHLAAAEAMRWGPAWAHRVAAADTVDDELADELAAGADYELARGAATLAATYLTWASTVTSSRELADERLLLAVRWLLIDGQTARAAELYPRIETCGQTALRDLVLGSLAYAQGDATTAQRWLVGVARSEASDTDDAWVRANALGQLALLYSLQGRGAEVIEAATAARALAPNGRLEIDHNIWWAWSSGEGMVHGAPAGLARLAERLPAVAAEVSGEDADLLVARGTLGLLAGATRAAVADLRTAIDATHRGFTVAQLPRAHVSLSQALFVMGDWDGALVHGRTALSLVVDEGRPWMRSQAEGTLVNVLASRGEWELAGAYVEAAREGADLVGTVETELIAATAAGALARARHDPHQVIDALAPLGDRGNVRSIPTMTMLLWWPTLITAVIDAGDVDAAARQIERFDEATGSRGLDAGAAPSALRARLAFARGDLATAASAFDDAIARCGPDDPWLDRALVHHAYGRLLRATGHRRRAVDQLTAAHEMLERVGAVPYRQRVADDLAASGLQVDPRPGGSPFVLTEREQDVVALVRQGMTNREVAAEIYVSVKAVEYHLGNVYAKLGISSRRELQRLPM